MKALSHAKPPRDRDQRHFLSAALAAAAVCAALSIVTDVRPALAQTVAVVDVVKVAISDAGRRIVLTTGGSKEELQKTDEFNYSQDQK